MAESRSNGVLKIWEDLLSMGISNCRFSKTQTNFSLSLLSFNVAMRAVLRRMEHGTLLSFCDPERTLLNRLDFVHKIT